MTRLVNDTDFAVLLKMLSTVEGMVEVSDAVGQRYIKEAIDAIRTTAGRWITVPPMMEGSYKRELIQANIMGECGDHGLFFDDSLGREVTEDDCPECIYDQEHAEEIAKQIQADILSDRLWDARDERNSQIPPTPIGNGAGNA